MSQRVTTLCIAVGLTALVGNSTFAYAAGWEPAVFEGPAFVVLLAAWLVCVVVWIVAERAYRREIRERVEDLKIAVAVSEWTLMEPRLGRPPVN